MKKRPARARPRTLRDLADVDDLRTVVDEAVLWSALDATRAMMFDALNGPHGMTDDQIQAAIQAIVDAAQGPDGAAVGKILCLLGLALGYVKYCQEQQDAAAAE